MKPSARMCRVFNAPAPFLPVAGTERFRLRCPRGAHHMQSPAARHWLEGNLLQCFSWLPAGMERMCALHYPLGSLRNQCHLLELQRPATNKGLLQRWAGQPHFSESVLLTCFSHRTGNPEVARVVLPQVTLVWEPSRICGLSLSLCYGK